MSFPGYSQLQLISNTLPFWSMYCWPSEDGHGMKAAVGLTEVELDDIVGSVRVDDETAGGLGGDVVVGLEVEDSAGGL